MIRNVLVYQLCNPFLTNRTINICHIKKHQLVFLLFDCAKKARMLTRQFKFGVAEMNATAKK